MNRKFKFLSVFDINPLMLFCIFFTVTTAINAVMSIGSETQQTFFHMTFGQAVLCAIPILSSMVLNLKPISKRLDESVYGVVIGLILLFIVSIGMVILASFVGSLFIPLPYDISWGMATRDSVISFIQGFAFMLLGAKIIDIRRTLTANNDLRTIQKSLANKIINEG